MKKVTIFLSSILLLFVLVGCEKKNKESQNQQESENQEWQTKEGKASSKKSLKDIMSSDDSMKCTWQGEESGVMTEGVVYVDGEKFKQEVSFTENSQESTMYSLSDGEWVYTWSSKSSQGTKMKMDEFDDEQLEDDLVKKQGDTYQAKQQLEKDYEFKCEKWNEAGNKFSPPSDIQFQDASKMMEQMQQQAGGETGKSKQQTVQDACDMCGTLPSPIKEECLDNCK